MVRTTSGPRTSVLVLLAATFLSTLSDAPRAQSTDPSRLPLIAEEDLKYIGSFAVDTNDGTGIREGSMTYGGRALSVNPATNTLIIGGHAWYNRLCEVAIPGDFDRGTRVLQQCSDITEGRYGQIDEGQINLGGSLIYKGRLIVSLFSYYDANGNQEKSHFVSGLNLSQMGDVQGPFRVGRDQPAGFVSGYMGLVPDEWQAQLGGPAVTGNCCLSIISRTSSGPALSSFNPDDVGRANPVSASELLGYPLSNELAPGRGNSPFFNLTTMIKGVAFPSGTRSVLFFGKLGTGAYCYGETTLCPDPANPYKGAHMYPYRHQVWAYDANDLADVKRGRKRPWEVQPYATWRLTQMNDTGNATISGATYDPVTRRVYITTEYGESPRVHAYEIARK